MLEQQQILKQTISLSQRQSLEVLAMNNLELREFLGREQLENPLLEVELPSARGEELVDMAQWLQNTLPRVENGVYRDESAPAGREPSAGEQRTYREDLKEQLYSLGIGAGRLELLLGSEPGAQDQIQADQGEFALRLPAFSSSYRPESEAALSVLNRPPRPPEARKQRWPELSSQLWGAGRL